MSKTIFTDKEVKQLSKNKWIKKISNKAITYTDDFKTKIVKETEDYKKIPQDIFRECGLKPEVVGMDRLHNAASRWRKQYKNTGELKDTRKDMSGRPRIHDLSDSEKLKRAEAKIKLLEAENELLKKNEMIEMGLLKEIKSISSLKQ